VLRESVKFVPKRVNNGGSIPSPPTIKGGIMETNSEVRARLKPLYDKIETHHIRDFDMVYVLRSAEEWKTLKEYLRRNNSYKVAPTSVSGEPEKYPCLTNADFIDGDCWPDALYFDFVYVSDLQELINLLQGGAE